MTFFNKYEQEFKGDKFLHKGMLYNFDRIVKGKYRYVPQRREVSTPAELKRERKLDALLIAFNTRELAKKINRAFGGRLEGASKTTQSVYTRLHSGHRIRVACHDVYAKRSESDYNIMLRKDNIYINGEYLFELLPEMTVEDIYNIVIKHLKLELK